MLVEDAFSNCTHVTENGGIQATSENVVHKLAA